MKLKSFLKWMPALFLIVGTLSVNAQPVVKLRNIEAAPGSGYTLYSDAQGKWYAVTSANGAVNVNLTPIAYYPSTTGNPANNNEIVIDPDGAVWVIDEGGEAIMLKEATSGGETVLTAGVNVTITGTGTSGDPYIINSPLGGGDVTTAQLGDSTALLRQLDTTTVLIQDSILVYSVANVEVGRDTISGTGGIANETDPTVAQHIKDITTTDITNWNTDLVDDADADATNEIQTSEDIVVVDNAGNFTSTYLEGVLVELDSSLGSGGTWDHTATQDIDAAGYDIDNVGTLSTGYVKQNNLYATGIRTNISNIYVGDTVYLGMLTKVGFTGSQALKIDIRGYNGYSTWMLKSYSSSYTDLILEHYYSNNSAYDFSEIVPLIWTDGNNVHIAITNTGTIPSYTTSCSISDYGGYGSTWTKAVSTDLPAGFTADALTRKPYSLDDVRANKLSSETYYEDDIYAVGMHSSRITVNAGDTLYIGSLEKSIIDVSSSSIEIDITGYLSYSKWVLSGYGSYKRIMLAYSNQNSGSYDPASVKPVIWVDGNTYHIAIANTSSAPSYATNVRLNELAATKKSTWTKAVSTDLPVGFTANVLTEKANTFNSVKINGNISVAGDAAFGNYIFNTDQPISTGFAGNKPFGLNVTTEELEVLNNISSFYVDVEDISARFSSSLLDNVLYELLNKIEELEAQKPYLQLVNNIPATYSSASPLTVNQITGGGAWFSYNTITDEATYTHASLSYMKIEVQAIVHSSINNELKLSIYEGTNEIASTTIDSSTDKDQINVMYVNTFSTNDAVSVKISSVDQAGAADLTVDEITTIITHINYQ